MLITVILTFMCLILSFFFDRSKTLSGIKKGLLMVGVITIPIEKKYFGLKVTLIRNFTSFVAALGIGLLIGVLWRMF